MGFRDGRRLAPNTAEEGGSDCDSTAIEWTVEILMPPLPPAAAEIADRRFCIAGRSWEDKEGSASVSTSLPTEMDEMEEAGRKGRMLEETHAEAADRDDAREGISALAVPTTREMPVPARERMMAGSMP